MRFMSRVMKVIFLLEARAIVALGKSEEQLQVSKGKTWSHDTNSCFAIVPLT